MKLKDSKLSELPFSHEPLYSVITVIEQLHVLVPVGMTFHLVPVKKLADMEPETAVVPSQYNSLLLFRWYFSRKFLTHF